MSAEDKTLSRWTPERLRTYKGFEEFNDIEADRAIETLDRLARILLSVYNQTIAYEQFGNSARLWKR